MAQIANSTTQLDFDREMVETAYDRWAPVYDLVFGGVFSKGRNLFVYLQAYEQGAETARPLLAFVTLFNGYTKSLETPPLKIAASLPNRLKTMPIRFDIPLAAVPPGEYNCQVTVLDPTQQKAAFWQTPIMVVP